MNKKNYLNKKDQKLEKKIRNYIIRNLERKIKNNGKSIILNMRKLIEKREIYKGKNIKKNNIN